MDCQFHNNCGGYCETQEEKAMNLCEDCLAAEKEDAEFNLRLRNLVVEAQNAVELLDKTGAGADALEAVARKLAVLYD